MLTLECLHLGSDYPEVDPEMRNHSQVIYWQNVPRRARVGKEGHSKIKKETRLGFQSKLGLHNKIRVTMEFKLH